MSLDQYRQLVAGLVRSQKEQPALSMEAAESIQMDPNNPGEFFACCGLLQLADCLWPGVLGWFDSHRFYLAPPLPTDKQWINRYPYANYSFSVANLLAALAAAEVHSNISPAERQRFAAAIRNKERTSQRRSTQRRLRREAIGIVSPFLFWATQWREERQLRTWRNRQEVRATIAALHAAIRAHLELLAQDPFCADSFCAIPGLSNFRFDARFAFTPGAPVRPVVEFAAFFGLEWRPAVSPYRVDGLYSAIRKILPAEIVDSVKREGYTYYTWQRPLSACVARYAVSGRIHDIGAQLHHFGLYHVGQRAGWLPALPWG